MAYVKSHSNYVLKKLHQKTNSGDIWERDITTIGGVERFSPGQIPVYSSGNFVLTVNVSPSAIQNSNSTPWEKNEEGEDTWTLESIEGMITSERDDDTTVVIKQNYEDLRDFAYYGSCEELIRGSITGIMQNFPGEMYATKDTVPYDFLTIVGKVDPNEEPYQKPESGYTDDYRNALAYYMLDNPFGINLHSKEIPDGLTEVQMFRYFTNENYKNYNVIIDGVSGATTEKQITNLEWEKELDSEENSTPDKSVGEIVLTLDDGDKVLIEFFRVNCRLLYMTKRSNIHIRPNSVYLNDFYKSLDSFQRIILNPNTTPRYKSTFNITKDSDFGYTNEMETFIFPTTYGGYNISVANEDYGGYVGRFMKIAEFYDEEFCDNLYRSMSPESIKTFDFTRSFDEEETKEYNLGGERIKKTLHLWAREFDEIKSHIDALQNTSTITYKGTSDAPNYVLTDLLNNDGWDTKLVYPYVENKTKNKALTKQIETHTFARDFDSIVMPFYGTTPDKGIEDRKCHKSLSSSKEYTNRDISNIFLRNLKINSKALLRSKGTISGVEMLLGLFGLKKGDNNDFTIQEYTVATSGLSDDEGHIDYYNSKKLISYQYEGEGDSNAYVPYQGLPVRYFEDGDKRILFPHFDQNEQLDGNPYYQMNGGWQSKYFNGYDTKFFIDKNDSFIRVSGSDDSFYKETLRNVKNVNNITELFNLSYDILEDNVIYYVNNINDDLIIINGVPFPAYKKDVDGKEVCYVKLKVINNTISIPGKYSVIFSENVTILNETGIEETYNIDFLSDGYELDAYYVDGRFVLRDENIKIFYFDIIKDGKTKGIANGEKATNYFKMINFGNGANTEFYNEQNKSGWKQLSEISDDYIRLNSIDNYFEGNNPHNGNHRYDNGIAYLKNFETLFSYACDNDLFECFSIEELDKIREVGFTDILSGHSDINYAINEDSKVNGFISVFKPIENEGDYSKRASLSMFKTENDVTNSTYYKNQHFENGLGSGDTFVGIATCPLNPSENTSNGHESEDEADLITNKIVNTKRINVTFILKRENDAEEIKYIDAVILPYMEQMIPSNSILSITYKNP